MDDETVDRVKLRQERKERKLLKKQAKRIEQQKEHEKKYLEIKFGPKDHRVKLISNNLANNINNSLGICKTNSSFNIENLDNNFPSLEQTCHLKNKSLTQNIKTPLSHDTNEEKKFTKRKKSSPIVVNITEILSAPSISKDETRSEKNKIIKPLRHGNMLDASQPIQLRGKRREFPKRKQLSKLKTQIISDSKINVEKNDYDGIHSPNFETYCDHIITEDLNLLVKDFLTDIVRFQEHLYKRDKIKGIAKRRYIIGLREVKKYVLIRKLKCIIIAPNIRTIVENGALDAAVHDLISLAKENEIPYIFALSRWKLGEITLKCRPISCVGIFDYSGGEQKYDEILQVLTIARNTYTNLLPTNENILNEDNATQEIVQKFVNVCTS